MKALRLPTPHPGRFWFATGFRAALRGSCSPKRSRADGGAARAWAVWSAGGPVPAGVRVDGVGSHRFPGDPSRAFARLEDPGRISGPSPKRSHRCCPRTQHDEGFSGHMISRLPQGFSTRCLRFACDVAAARARLASGWLVGLCRERVELSGSRRKVSERSHVILLSRAYPVASWASRGTFGFVELASPNRVDRIFGAGERAGQRCVPRVYLRQFGAGDLQRAIRCGADDHLIAAHGDAMFRAGLRNVRHHAPPRLVTLGTPRRASCQSPTNTVTAVAMTAATKTSVTSITPPSAGHRGRGGSRTRYGW